MSERDEEAICTQLYIAIKNTNDLLSETVESVRKVDSSAQKLCDIYAFLLGKAKEVHGADYMKAIEDVLSFLAK